MENQNTVNPNPVSPEPVSPPSRTNKLPIILGIMFLLLIVGGGAYYLGSQNKNVVSSNKQPAVSPTSITDSNISPTTTESTNTLPPDWTLKNSATCKVGIPFPPQKEPYIIPDNPNTPPAVDDEGASWTVVENNSSEPLFTYIVTAVFSNPNAPGSGYIPGSIQVKCAPNTQNYTTQTLLDAYKKPFTDGTYSGLEVSKAEEVTLWGRKVYSVYITGGMLSRPIYIFATPSTIYSVDTVSMSTNQFVKDTTQQIFNNLKFSQ